MPTNVHAYTRTDVRTCCEDERVRVHALIHTRQFRRCCSPRGGHLVTGCNPLQNAGNTAARCTTLLHAAPRCNTRQHTATHCHILKHTATQHNALQNTATHCNTLQHIATHCNTLQQRQHTATRSKRQQHTHFFRRSCSTRDQSCGGCSNPFLPCEAKLVFSRLPSCSNCIRIRLMYLYMYTCVYLRSKASGLCILEPSTQLQQLDMLSCGCICDTYPYVWILIQAKKSLVVSRLPSCSNCII